MPWNEATGGTYSTTGTGYPDDLTDGEWSLIEPSLRKWPRCGRPRTTDLRIPADALLLVLQRK